MRKTSIKDEFTTAFEYAAIGMALVNKAGRFIKVNKSLCKLMGYTSDELTTLTFQEVTHPDDLNADLEFAQKLFRGEIDSYQFEKRYFTKSGEIIWINLSGSKVSNSEGRFKHFIAQIENITPRKTALKELEDQKRRAENILEGTNAGTWEWNVQTGETEFNEKWAGIIGYTLEELAPISIKTWEYFTHPDDLAHSGQVLQDCFDRKTDYYECECRMRHKDGHWVWVLDRGKVISWTVEGKPLMMFGTHIEISNLKKLEREALVNKAFLDNVLDEIQVGIVVCDQDGILKLFNKKASEMHGLTVNPIGSKDWSSAYNLFDIDGVTPLKQEEIPLYQALKMGGISNTEFIIQHVDGNQIVVLCDGNQIMDEEGGLLGAVVAMHDVTEIKMANQKIEEIANKFKGIFDSTFQFIGFLTPDGILTEANQTAIDFAGVPENELIGKPFWDCHWWTISEETQKTLKLNIEKAAKGEFVRYEVEVLGKDSTVTIHFNLKPLFDTNGKVIAIIPEGRPIQEIVDARKALIQKNEELERFAHIASHDLKEPLRLINSFMRLLHKNYATQLDEKANKYINFALDATRRMTILINDLLEYAKIGADDTLFEHIHTKPLLEEIITLYQVELDLKGGGLILKNLPDILGQKTPIKLLFQNLVGNAMKYQKSNNPPHIQISGRELMDSWEFCVEDNGIGIPKQHFEEIFLMFKRLHTKENYAGTGMGLATCKKIVTRHGGEIWVKSIEGEGSKFFFTIKK